MLTLFYEMKPVIQTIMYYYREKVVEILLKSGLKLHVYGDSWKNSPFYAHSGLCIHPEVNAEQGIEVLQNSKISLNVMAWHKDGFTERIACKRRKYWSYSRKSRDCGVKLAMGQLVKMGRFKDARAMFYEYLKIRPDIRLEMSDVRREIPDIELILYILEQEQQNGLTGFYAVSDNLNDLIVHLRKIREIVKKEAARKRLSTEEQVYLTNKNVTGLAKEIIRINL